jgi:hypothetical protein
MPVKRWFSSELLAWALRLSPQKQAEAKPADFLSPGNGIRQIPKEKRLAGRIHRGCDRRFP